MTGKESSNLVLFKENRNRQSAPGVAHKIKKTNKEKLEQKSNHIACRKGTHTTLRCCVARHVGNPQKTGVLGPRLVSRAGVQALFCVPSAYGCKLLSLYINSLSSRPSLTPSNAWEA